ncbi:MAG: HNH endonuclease signature motif containing protein [Actinomycetota bacterium]
MSVRISIPAELKRKILVEAGHRCAIPTCRYPTTEIAHIIPYSEVKSNEENNLIALCPNCHTRYDKGEIDRKSMMMYKRKITFLSDRYSKFELNVLDYLRKNKKVIVYGYTSVKNLIDDGLIKNAHTIVYFTYTDGIRENQEFVIVLTEQGKEFIEKWVNINNNEFTYD